MRRFFSFLFCALVTSITTEVQGFITHSIPDTTTQTTCYQGKVTVSGASRTELYQRLRNWADRPIAYPHDDKRAVSTLISADSVTGVLVGKTSQLLLWGPKLRYAHRLQYCFKIIIVKGSFSYSFYDLESEKTLPPYPGMKQSTLQGVSMPYLSRQACGSINQPNSKEQSAQFFAAVNKEMQEKRRLLAGAMNALVDKERW